MEMNIEYPAMVEQGLEILTSMGIDTTKDQVYKRMIEMGMIDQTGQPTQVAIDAGLVEMRETNYQPITLATVKQAYPEYQQFDDSHFFETEHGWAADAYVVRTLANQCLHDPNITAEQRQHAYLMLQQADEMEKMGK